jgi:F-type H+-transporting ATPase subunit delta
MRGTSRASLAAARERLAGMLSADQAAGGAGGGQQQPAASGTAIGAELFAVTGLLDRDHGLRRALSDPSRDGQARAGLARTLLSGKVSDATLDLVTGLAAERWSGTDDLPDAAEQLAVLAIVEAAAAQGQLDELEDELFRFSRIVQANPALRAALSGQFVPGERKRELALALVEGKVTPPGLALITQAVAQPRGHGVESHLAAYANLVADQRERLVAEVHVAIPLTEDQRSRLAAALAAGYGRDVHLNVVLDPQVVGGMSVRIGDELINGSVAGRLAELQRKLAS